MASLLIHLAVASVIDKELNIENKYDYYLGSIAPDLAKQINKTKKDSHFLYYTKEFIPNMEYFTNKYPNFKNNAYDLGYYVHLYTDYLFYGKFTQKKYFNNATILLDGTIYRTSEVSYLSLMYQDYNNVTNFIYDNYDIDLSIFNEQFKEPITSITEIPTSKLNLLIDKGKKFISKDCYTNTPKVFDNYDIKNFIDEASQDIIRKIKSY